MWNWVTIGRDVLGWQMSLVNALYRKQKINWKARVDSLIQILNRSKDPEQFTNEVRLLQYYSEAREKRRIKRLKFIYSILKKNILRRLLKGTATIKQFNFYKLMLLIDQIEKDQKRNSSA